jgi:ABC-type sulfate/molybdate transport systems, ATPase component
VVMNHGRIEQIGTPDEVYSSPASPFVYQFLGNVNVFHSRLHGAWAEVGRDPSEEPEHDRDQAMAFVRPHDIDIERGPIAGGIEATVQDVHAIGPLVRVELAHASELVEVELTRERANVLRLVRGQAVWLKPARSRCSTCRPKRWKRAGRVSEVCRVIVQDDGPVPR